MEDRRQSWSGSEHSTSFNSPLPSPSMGGSNSSTPQTPLQYFGEGRTSYDPFSLSSSAMSVSELEDDGDSDEKSGVSRKDIHTINEQRRRDIIKQSYSTLEKIVPTCKPNPGSTRLSRATVLLKTSDYMCHLEEQSKKQAVKLEALRKEVKALEIMKENYEQMVRVQGQQGGFQTSASAPAISNDVKMKLFQNLVDCLFQSFNAQVSVETFDRLSSCVISWLEDSCSPQNFHKLVSSQLKTVGVSSVPSPPRQPH